LARLAAFQYDIASCLVKGLRVIVKQLKKNEMIAALILNCAPAQLLSATLKFNNMAPSLTALLLF